MLPACAGAVSSPSHHLSPARFKAAHDPSVVQRFWARAKLPAWDALEVQFRKGPPPFLRPGWQSPLLGKRVDLRWLDVGPFDNIKGSVDGWQDAKLLIIEFWASYVQAPPLGRAAGRVSRVRGCSPAWRPQGTGAGCRPSVFCGRGWWRSAGDSRGARLGVLRVTRTSVCILTPRSSFAVPACADGAGCVQYGTYTG